MLKFSKILIVTLASAVMAACSPLKILNALTSDAAVRHSEGLSFGPHPRQKLDVYSPDSEKAASPVIVFFYGGSWNSGSRSDYAFVGHTLARQGYVTVVADYRLYPEVRYPAFLEDAALAVAWAAKHADNYGGDPEKLFVMGHSAGAYNAAMLALDKRWLAAVGMMPAALRGWIGLAGPYDFLPLTNEDVKPVFFHPNTPSASQPIMHVTRKAPPALLIAPVEDEVVNPVRNTGGLAKALRKCDVSVEEVYFARPGHATLLATLSMPFSGYAPTIEKINQFVQAQIQKEAEHSKSAFPIVHAQAC